MTLINRKIKHAIRDLGAVEGNDTPGAGIYNDRAAKRASRHFEIEGGYVDGWEGVFRFRSAWAIGASESWGLRGCGMGTSRWPPDFSGAHGTVFRYEGQGNFITASAANCGEIKDIAFWPLLHKTSGAEIMLKDRCNTNTLERLLFNLPYRAVHIENSVYTDCEKLTSYSPYGDAHFLVTGSPTTLTSHNEKAVFRRCNAYMTLRHATLPGASTFTNYTPGTPQAMPLGQYTEINGHVWQATTGGTTSGTGPAAPSSWALAHDRTGIFVTDGSVIWGWIMRSFNTGWLADSGGDYMVVDNCESNAASAVKAVNTFSGGTAPKKLHAMNGHYDHCWSHTIWIEAACREFNIHHNHAEASARGTGICLGHASQDEFAVTDNYLAHNAGGQLTNVPGANGTTRIVERNILVN